jgi:uncharacterized protein (TIGR00255 family)
MTGYGAGQSTRDGVLVKVELRAVNHRFFDPSIRTPREFPGFESRVKDALKAHVARGRVSVTVEVGREADRPGLTVDEALAAEYWQVLRSLGEKHGLPPAADALALAQLPDLLHREAPAPDPDAAAAALDEALDVALGQLAEMRAAEGRALEADLAARVAHVEELLDRIERAAAGAAEQVQVRLRERLARLLGDAGSVDADRLAQEVALLADRADIVEELVRFRAHDRAFLEFLGREEPVGKRLDFLLQEMNREVNTIGSKSQDAGIAHLVVEVKEEIERLREQVQNIE